MSTENDELRDRDARLGKEFDNSRVHPDGFQDPSGEYPRTPYFYGPSTNLAARGIKRNELYIGGGNIDMDLDLDEPVTSMYPYNQVDESRSGHIIEIDDTPGGERILIKHRTGAGVEIRPDGSVVVATRNNLVHIVHGDNKVIVEGDAHLAYNGNLDIDVSGDMNVKVGGNYNVEVGNDEKHTVSGNRRNKVYGNSGDAVIGNRSETTTEVFTETTLGNKNSIVGGNHKEMIEGTNTVSSSGDMKIATQATGAISANNMNVAGQNISVFGATGVIGGETVTMYYQNAFGKSATYTDGVTSPNFTGDLTGRADEAINADNSVFAAKSPAASGGPNGWENDDTPTDDTQPDGLTDQSSINAGVLADYLGNSTLGTPTVIVDAADELKNALDDTSFSGGVANRPLNTREVRSKMRDGATFVNSRFVTQQVSRGVLNPEYTRSAPPVVGRVTGKEPTTFLGLKFLGQIEPAGATRRVKPRPSAKPIIPDPRYNPNLQTEITPKTKLSRGVTLAKFLGGRGDKVSIDHIVGLDNRKAIARQFYLHAEAMKSVSEDTGKFKDHRMVVTEGLYRKAPGETLTSGSFNDKAQKGLVVVYELLDQNGKIDLLKTFDLAVHLKDNLFYNKISLSYDYFNPSGELHCEIIIEMPEVSSTFIAQYNMEVETLFNNKVQANKEFIEILQN